MDIIYVIIAIPIFLFFCLLLGGLFRIIQKGGDDPHAPASKDPQEFWKVMIIGAIILFIFWWVSS